MKNYIARYIKRADRFLIHLSQVKEILPKFSAKIELNYPIIVNPVEIQKDWSWWFGIGNESLQAESEYGNAQR